MDCCYFTENGITFLLLHLFCQLQTSAYFSIDLKRAINNIKWVELTQESRGFVEPRFLAYEINKIDSTEFILTLPNIGSNITMF